MKTPPDRNFTAKYEDLLEEKVRALREYFSVTQTLQEHIPLEDLEGLQALLTRREEVAKHVDRLNVGLERLRSQLSRDLGNLPVEIRERCRILGETARGLLNKTASLESACLAQIARQRDRVQEELRQKSGDLKALHTYAGPTSSVPRFMDMTH